MYYIIIINVICFIYFYMICFCKVDAYSQPLGVGDGVDALEVTMSVHDADEEVFLTAVL